LSMWLMGNPVHAGTKRGERLAFLRGHGKKSRD
jgi:hypothetical protein